MTKLVLHPTIDQLSTKELEQHIEQVRARRVVGAMEYAAGQRLKLDAEVDKIHRKLMAQYEMLGKELDRCERAIVAVESRIASIEELRQQAGLILDYEDV